MHENNNNKSNGQDSELKQIRRHVADLGEPYVKAKAAFVAAASASSGNLSKSALKYREEVIRQLNASKPLNDALQNRVDRVGRKNMALAAAGKLKCAEFVMPVAPPNHGSIRDVLRSKGMSENDLAAKTNMGRERIGRVLRNPDRSTLGTIRKIAAALDVDIRQLV